MEIELYVILWLLRKFVTETTRDHWFVIYNKNDDKCHIRKYIKYNIVIIFQYTIAENVPFVVQYYEKFNKSISINHPLYYNCIITNNPQCLVY